MTMYIVKIYRKNTVEIFASFPVWAETEEQARIEALNLDTRTQEIVRIEVS